MQQLSPNFDYPSISSITLAVSGFKADYSADTILNDNIPVIFPQTPVVNPRVQTLSCKPGISSIIDVAKVKVRFSWIGPHDSPAILESSTWINYGAEIEATFLDEIEVYIQEYDPSRDKIFLHNRVFVIRKDVGFFYIYFRILVSWFWLTFKIKSCFSIFEPL